MTTPTVAGSAGAIVVAVAVAVSVFVGADRGAEEEENVFAAMQAMMWASRADSSPEKLLGGRTRWQTGHSSSGGIGGAGRGPSEREWCGWGEGMELVEATARCWARGYRG